MLDVSKRPAVNDDLLLHLAAHPPHDLHTLDVSLTVRKPALSKCSISMPFWINLTVPNGGNAAICHVHIMWVPLMSSCLQGTQPAGIRPTPCVSARQCMVGIIALLHFQTSSHHSHHTQPPMHMHPTPVNPQFQNPSWHLLPRMHCCICLQRVTPGGLLQLLQHCRSVAVLRYACRSGDTGLDVQYMQALAAVLPAVQEVDLSLHPHLDDAGLAALAQCRTLRKVHCWCAVFHGIIRGDEAGTCGDERLYVLGGCFGVQVLVMHVEPAC